MARQPSAPASERVEEILGENQPFSSLDQETISEIARTSEKVFHASGDFVVREGEVSSGFFVILEGQLEAQQRGVSVRRMGPGQFFGETSLTEGEPRSADVVATQPTFCLKIDTHRFRDLVQANPRVGNKILEEMIRRNRTVVKAPAPGAKGGGSMPEEAFDFKSELARRVFESLVDSFARDYMVRRIVGEKCGWRTVGDIAQQTGASVRVLYGKHGGVGSALAEPIRRGLVETRFFPGERGRGGEVMRFRISYEKEPVRAYVNQKIRAGKKA